MASQVNGPQFNLDDLLDLRPPNQRGPMPNAAGAPLPPPSYPPPPPVNDDPYGFNSAASTSHGYPSATAPYTYTTGTIVQTAQTPVQQLAPQQQPGYGVAVPPQQYYAPTAAAAGAPSQTMAPQPSQYQQQMYAAPSVAQPAQPYATVNGAVVAPPPQPMMFPPPQQQSYMGYQQPQQTAQAPQANQIQQPHGAFPVAGMMPQQPPSQMAPYSYQPTPVVPFGAGDPGMMQAYQMPMPQQQQQQQQPLPSPGVPMMNVTATVAPMPVSNNSSEEADRLQLEKILRLRKELEREQELERQKREEKETWPCKDCTFRNKNNSTSCEMCGMARPGVSIPLPTAAPVRTSPPASTASTSPSLPPGSRWQCTVCGTANEYQNANCTACSGFRANGIPLPPLPSSSGIANIPQGTVRPPQSTAAAPASTPNTWECNVCTLMNPVSAAVCSACESGQRPRHLSPPPTQNALTQQQPRPTAGVPATAVPSSAPPASSWPCPTCTYENPVQIPTCNMCATPRPARFAPPQASQAVAIPMTQHQHPFAQLQRPGMPPQSMARPAPYPAYAQAQQVPPPSQPPAGEDDDAIQWQSDNAVTHCNKCNAQFNMLRRRHHCRACGFVFCWNCCQSKVVLKPGGQPEKVCIDCFREKR